MDAKTKKVESKPVDRKKGEGLVSHLIVLALVVLICVPAALTLSGAIGNAFGKASNKMNNLGNAVNAINIPQP